MSFFDELKRRNVLRVAAAYLVAAWLIVQVANEILPLFGFDESVSRIIVIVLAIGFIPAVIIAWVFELTPDGVARDSGSGMSANPAAIKRFDRIVILVLTVAVVFFAAERLLRPGPGPEPEVLTIAVLPFVNMSSDPEQEYFGDGLAEELLHLLQKVPGLDVTSRTSSFKFKHTDLSVREIAEELEVAHILEGSVRKSGNTLRITAQLIDSRMDSHLWSGTFDRELADVFDIQDEVAARVVEELKIKLDVDMPTSTRHDPEAYALYLKARALLQTDDPNALDEVKRLLEQALQIEPDFIDAQVATNLYYVRRLRIYRMGGPGASWELIEDYEEKRRTLLESLRQRAPEHPGVLVALAHPAISRGELADAAAMLEKVIARAPWDSEIWLPAMRLATDLNDISLAIAIGEYLTRIDPLNFWAHSNLADNYSATGRFEEAIKSYRVAANLSPDSDSIHWKLAAALTFAGRPDEALEALELESWLPYVLHGQVTAYHTLGDQRASDEALQKLHVEMEDWGTWPFGFARLYAWLGNADEAFRYIERVRAEERANFTTIAVNPYFRPLHDDPRWPALVEEIEEITSQISFNPTLPPEITSKR